MRPAQALVFVLNKLLSQKARNQRGRRPKDCSKARQPMALTSCCRTRRRAPVVRGRSGHVPRRRLLLPHICARARWSRRHLRRAAFGTRSRAFGALILFGARAARRSGTVRQQRPLALHLAAAAALERHLHSQVLLQRLPRPQLSGSPRLVGRLGESQLSLMSEEVSL